MRDELEDYLIDQSFYDRFPESHKVREYHNKVVFKMKDQLNKLELFKEWCVYDKKYFTTPKRWSSSDMKKKLDKLGLDDNYSDEVGLDD